MPHYGVYSLDVWAAEDGGYIVNDRYKVGTLELASDMPKDGDIISSLKKSAYLTDIIPVDKITVDCSDEADVFFIDVDHTPVLVLVRDKLLGRRA